MFTVRLISTFKMGLYHLSKLFLPKLNQIILQNKFYFCYITWISCGILGRQNFNTGASASRSTGSAATRFRKLGSSSYFATSQKSIEHA